MEGSLIAFRLATYDRNEASEFVTRRVGQRTSSHDGTCVIRRKGLLDEIPYVRRIRGVVIVRTEDAGRVVRLLERMGRRCTREGRANVEGPRDAPCAGAAERPCVPVGVKPKTSTHTVPSSATGHDPPARA